MDQSVQWWGKYVQVESKVDRVGIMFLLAYSERFSERAVTTYPPKTCAAEIFRGSG